MNPNKKVFNLRKLQNDPMKDYLNRKKQSLSKNQIHFIKEIRDPLPAENLDDKGRPLDDNTLGDVLISFD